MSSYYSTDLAQVHDEDFSQMARDAAGFIKSLTQPEHKKVLDLGSGSGTLARELVDAGFQVTGVDFSAQMVDIARKKVPEAEFVRKSIFEYEIPPCDIVCLIGEVINYLFDYKSDLSHLKTLFIGVHSQMNPSGFLLFDFLTPEVVTDGHLARRIIERKNWSMFVALDKDAGHEILTRDITLFYKQGEHHYRRTQETHRQRLYPASVLQTLLEQCGFQVDTIEQYGAEKFRTGQVGMICRKK